MRWIRAFGATLVGATWIAVACSSDETNDGPGTNVGGGDASADSATGGSAVTGGSAGASTASGGSNNGGSNAGGTTNGTSGNGNAGTSSANGGSAGNVWGGCRPFGELCAGAADCCSGVCDPNNNKCTSSVTQCAGQGSACQVNTDCCNLNCSSGKCAAEACIPDDEACTGTGCCSGRCVDDSCQPLNTECRTAGNTCGTDGECCSGLCGDDKTCKLGSSFCIQPGDVCARDADCCTADCVIVQGETLGICALPPSGPAFCSGVDGTICNDCGDCCSRLCAPFGPTGTKICQPANGCHVTGDLCQKDTDCCGGTLDTALPGYGNVKCYKENPDAKIGICRTPTEGPGPGGACNPQGNVCHYKNYECSISSARANCCGGLGAKGGVCQLDPLGIPRCNGLGDTCRQATESCASTDDCCNNAPCVPFPDGILRCATPPDGGTNCIPSGGGCTINADCCVGSICIRPPGSTVGTCSVTTPPGTGGAGGTGAGGTSGTAGSGGATVCAQYGQACTDSGDCCNDVPCTNGICMYSIR